MNQKWLCNHVSHALIFSFGIFWCKVNTDSFMAWRRLKDLKHGNVLKNVIYSNGIAGMGGFAQETWSLALKFVLLSRNRPSWQW